MRLMTSRNRRWTFRREARLADARLTTQDEQDTLRSAGALDVFASTGQLRITTDEDRSAHRSPHDTPDH
jgi:hypothetical protein